MGGAGSFDVTLRGGEILGLPDTQLPIGKLGVTIPLRGITRIEGVAGVKGLADSKQLRLPSPYHARAHTPVQDTHLCVLDLDGSLGDCLGDHLTLGGYHGNRLV